MYTSGDTVHPPRYGVYWHASPPNLDTVIHLVFGDVMTYNSIHVESIHASMSVRYKVPALGFRYIWYGYGVSTLVVTQCT